MDCNAIGDSWYDERRSPALLVPSAVTPGEYNLGVKFPPSGLAMEMGDLGAGNVSTSEP